MDSTLNKPDVADRPESLRAAWRHFTDMLTASSRSDAWKSCRKTVETLPTWAYVVVILCAIALASNGAFLVIPLAALGGFLLATYLTVKHAVRSALREHDGHRQG